MSGNTNSIDGAGARALMGVAVVLVIASCGGNSTQSTPPPPTANAGGPYAADVTQAITFDGSKSSDPSGLALTYSWSFGDNTTGPGEQPAHTYTATGLYGVTLTVTDSKAGMSAPATTSATITALPIANAGGSYKAFIGQSIVFDGSKSSTPDDTALSYVWTFGDGGTGSGANPSHTYSASGTFNVSLVVTDVRQGTSSATTTAMISSTPPPQIVQTNPINGATNVNTSANVVVTFSKAINASTVNAASFFVVDNKTTVAVPGLIQLDPSDITATFVPSQPLPSGDSFSATLTKAIEDLSGDHLPGNANFGFSTGQLPYEADSLTFSVLNGTPPPGSVGATSREIDSFTFSVLNGTPPPGSVGATSREVDSLTFSVLNGIPPVPAQPHISEVDSVTFSVLALQ
jgi:PKD repeat protein